MLKYLHSIRKQDSIVLKLREDVENVPESHVLNSTPFENEWIQNELRIRDHIRNDDPNRFCEWDVIRRTMFVDNQDYVRIELEYLRDLPNWSKRWANAINESKVGRPLKSQYYRKSSSNLIHHAYHLAQFEQATKITIDSLTHIVEFGGGYGSMCRLFYQLGYKGQYIIYDLPILCALQEFYLKSMEKRAPPHWPATTGFNVSWESEIEGLRARLSGFDRGSRSLFIATWSISEASLQIRQRVFELVQETACFLIAYQDRYLGMDNTEYFRSFAANLPGKVIWVEKSIPHLPGNSYLFGRPQS